MDSIVPRDSDEVINVTVDVLLICALKDEYDQVLKVTDGLMEPGWKEHPILNGLIVADGCFATSSGATLNIRTTHASHMGRENALAIASLLITDQPARCIAMSGICAGRRDDVALGDVIFADRMWSYDTGKFIEEDGKQRFQGDMLQYRPSLAWVQRMQRVILPPLDTPWLLDRPRLPLEYQENWVLLRILAGEYPPDHLDFKTACPNWKDVILRLWKRKWLKQDTLELTPAGQKEANRLKLLYPHALPEPANFQIHVAPVATGAAVTEDAGIFPRLAESMRKVLGIEMEASALCAFGEIHDLPVLVAKGVSDYGDLFKDNRYRQFAARASAECLIALLRESTELLQVSYFDGLAHYRSEQQILADIHELALKTNDKITALGALPTGREDSANKIISAQLDRTIDFLKVNRYHDALDHITAIGKDLGAFDAHQQARWHLQRGLILWLSGEDDKEAAELFLKAADLYPDDERMIAARIRGLMLKGELNAALDAGQSAVKRFPVSQQVWLAYTYARMIKGEVIRSDDAPSTIRDEPDVLQLFAISARKQLDFAEAVRLSEKAAAHQEAGFFTKTTALRLVVEDAARNTVAAMYGFLPKAVLDALERVTALFEPRQNELWSVQCMGLAEPVAHLGFAFLLKRDYKAALKLTEEAEMHGVSSKELLRIRIQALSELKRNNEALDLGRARLSDLTPQSIVEVGALAANRGDVNFLDEAIAEIKSWLPLQPETVDILTTLRWGALARTGEKDIVINEITDANLEANGNFVLTCGAASMLHTLGCPEEAAKLIAKAKSLVDENSPDSDRLMLADLLFTAGHWMEAAKVYEPFTPTGQISELHTKLLTCYLKADSRKRAKEFLSQLPDGWVENDDIRYLAMDLGQLAGDWAFLLPLADTQIRCSPEQAISWLFKLHVAKHGETRANFENIVRQVPEELIGSIQELAQLASLELHYNEAARGLRRFYRLVRRNYDEREVFSAYFISVVTASQKLPLMEEKLLSVVPGSSLTLIDELGCELQVVIDPSDVGALPRREGFLSPDSPEAAVLLGVQVDQTVAVTTQTGNTDNYTVKAIQSAYLRLMHIAQEHTKSLGGLPHMKSFAIGTSGEEDRDFGRLHEEIKQNNKISSQIVEDYGAGHLTLSGLAKMLGKSPIDVVTAFWPSNVTPIFIGAGLAQEMSNALMALARLDACYVTDALTLTELVNFGVSDVLGALPKVFISPATELILKEYLHDAEHDTETNVGTIIPADIDGHFHFIEQNPQYRTKRVSFAVQLMEAADKYCTVQPTYEELTSHPTALRLMGVLQSEEREMLLLAKEHGATLLTLDGRLRLIAKVCFLDLNGVWPQALVRHCLAAGYISPAKSAEFTINQFLTNRKFVSLNAEDLIWMVWQGDKYLQDGIQNLKRYLESPETDFESSANVVQDFLAAILRQGIQLDVLGELLVHFVEPIFRRKDCPPDLQNVLAKFLDDLLINSISVVYAYPPANWLPIYRIRLQQQYLRKKIAEAWTLAHNPPEMRPIAIRVVYGTKIPTLILHKSISEPETDKESLQ
jgi:nucleoside phosphorylase